MNSETESTNSTTSESGLEPTEAGLEPTAPGPLQAALIAEIEAGLARLGVSREELHAEVEIYASTVEHYPEAYEPFPLSMAFRARAVELLGALIQDGMDTCIEWNDDWIAELREALPGAAGRPSPALTAQFKKAKNAAHEKQRAGCAD